MREIKQVKTNYNSLVKKLDAMAELIALYHDQPLNVQRASEYLGLAKATLYQMVHKNTIPHYKPTSKMLFFSRLELNKWVFINKIPTQEEIESKANKYVLWGEKDWEWRDYKLIYKK